jgi:hypothetical protein
MAQATDTDASTDWPTASDTVKTRARPRVVAQDAGSIVADAVADDGAAIASDRRRALGSATKAAANDKSKTRPRIIPRGDGKSRSAVQAVKTPPIPRRLDIPKKPATAKNDSLATAYAQFIGEAGTLGDVITSAPEVIEAPEPAPRSEFKSGGDESGPDRELRPVTEVPLDIRPSAGEMPTPPAGLVELPTTLDAHENGEWPAVVCSYTPWTICYRPLYFEQIELERYGDSWGIVQPGVSAVYLFGSAIAMPYKMVVRPPRSCVCSNGFSRCEDCRPPGYRQFEWNWKAAAIEAGIVAGVMIALPFP